MKSPCIVLAGGGTGGHIFPLLAVAEALRERVDGLSPIFVGTDRGLESRLVPPTGIPLELLHSVPFRGGGLSGAVRGLWGVVRCLPAAIRLLRLHRPSVVLSSGGYAAVPIALAARLVRIPLALIEPNGAPGLANRLSGPLARRVYTVFEATASHFRADQVLHTGHALRAGFEPSPYGLEANATRHPRLLVLGGSQGAKSLNESIPRALAGLSTPVEVLHQVGRGNLEEAKEHYKQVSQHAVELVEFIDDMPVALENADLVLSRAGTGHIAEECAVGRPSVLIPLASSGVGQLDNALAVQSAGAAVCIAAKDANPETIGRTLTTLLSDPGLLTRMAGQAKLWGRPHAAGCIAADLAQLGHWPQKTGQQ